MPVVADSNQRCDANGQKTIDGDERIQANGYRPEQALEGQAVIRLTSKGGMQPGNLQCGKVSRKL
jgi:hypothetical protein